MLFVVGCFAVSWGLSFFRQSPTPRLFAFPTEYSISNVIGILAVLIAFVTLVVGVGAFWGYASLKDVAERKATEVAAEVAKKITEKIANEVASKKTFETFTTIKDNISKEQQVVQETGANKGSASVSEADKTKSVSGAVLGSLNKIAFNKEE